MQLSIKKSAPVLPTPELIRLPGKPINHLEQVFNYEKYNAKTILQEYTQSINKDLPIYQIIDVRGESHNCEFTAQVEYENKILGYGIGKSKKEAQSKAAYQACVTLKLIKEE